MSAKPPTALPPSDDASRTPPPVADDRSPLLPLAARAELPPAAARLGPRPRPTTLAAAAAAACKLLVHLATLTPYGFFRDELYYLACARHLAFGYVDQPPLSVFALRVWTTCFGDSLAAVRVAAALVGASVVFVVGLLAAELGGGVTAVLLAAAGVLSAGQYLGFGHFYSMNVFDELFWALGSLVAVRALNRGRPQDWLLLGVVLGLGLLNKISVLWLGAGLALGMVLTPARAWLRTRWPYAAAALALIVFSPYLAWESAHGFPTLEFMSNATTHKYVTRSAFAFARENVLQQNPTALPVWLAGLVALLGRRLGPRAAVLGWVYVVTFALLVASPSAKAEYLGPAYAALFAAGGVACERVFARLCRPHSRTLAAASLGALALAGGAFIAPFALACLPEEGFIAYARATGLAPAQNERRAVGLLPQFYADMHGWAELTAAVADVYDGLAPDEKKGVTLWSRSGGYGPAAAIEYFGRARGLPPPICAYNNYWYWGTGAGDGLAVIVVGGARETIEPLFESLTQVATFECHYCRPDEDHKPIYVGRHLECPLAEIWPAERYFD